MKRILLLLVVFLPAMLLCCALDGQTNTAKQISVPGFGNLGFYEFRPAGYGSQLNPLIIFLHGAGQTGAGTIGTELDKLLQAGIPMLISQGATMRFGSDAFVVLAPQTSNNFNAGGGGEYWRIPAILQYAKDSLHIDTNRIYITGLSMGGGGVWEAISYDPAVAGQFVAAAPISAIEPFPDTSLCTIAKLDIPVWTFHNDQDPMVDPYTPIRILNTINGCTNPAIDTVPRKTYYASNQHDAWDDAYDTGHHSYALSTDPNFAGSVSQASLNLYEWFLQHHRASSTVVVTPPAVGVLGYLIHTGAPLGDCGDTTAAGRFPVYGDSLATNTILYTDSGRTTPYNGGGDWYEFAPSAHGPVQHDLVVNTDGSVHSLSDCPGTGGSPGGMTPLGYIKVAGGPGGYCGDTSVAGRTPVYGDSLADGVILSPDPQRTNPLDGGYNWYAYSATLTGAVMSTFADYADGSVHSLQACGTSPQSTKTTTTGAAGGFEPSDGNASLVYPNPAHDEVTLHVTGQAQGTVMLHVYTATGSLLLTMAAVKGAEVLDLPFSVSRLPAGVYFIEIQVGGAVCQRQKLMKL